MLVRAFLGWWLGWAFVVSVVAEARPSSFRVAHPVAWMHMPPVGETPGWQGTEWLSFETGHASIWNSEMQIYNALNQRTITYLADFEQTTILLESGHAITPWLSFGFELPFVSRDGGFMDAHIDSFHRLIGSERFNRETYPQDQFQFQVSENNEPRLAAVRQGVGNIKYKIKQWWWRWQKTADSCPCGLATSQQLKVPLANVESGLTSGGLDVSYLLHVGVPYSDYSAVWLTAAASRLSQNPTLDGLPQKRWQQMYEMSSDFAFNARWGFLFVWRWESPILDGRSLYIVNQNSEPADDLLERIGTGWNSLVHWRGSQGFGVRFRPSPDQNYQLIFTEDWGLGDQDNLGDIVYANNAPDAALLLQVQFAL